MTEHRNDYTRRLEEALKSFLEPIKGTPFPVVIEALAGYRVLKFDRRRKTILSLLVRASNLAGQEAAKRGIVAERPNEAGNRIEPFVLDALNKVGFVASKARTKKGTVRTAGYPDIELRHEKSGWIGYLDCKTFATKSVGSTFRAFYLSPSQEPKITQNASHLLLSFELHPKSHGTYVPLSWHLLDIHGLEVQVKHEFNASNRDLYRDALILAAGKLPT